MVVKLVRWPLGPPLSSKKFQVIVNLRRLEGLRNLSVEDLKGFAVEIKWKGQKASYWRPSVKRNYTEKGVVGERAESVDWNEEFTSLCSFLGSKQHPIPPWELLFTVFQRGDNKVPLNNCTVIGTASLNISQYICWANGKDISVTLPLKVNGSAIQFTSSLILSVNLLELRVDKNHSKMAQRSIVPVTLSPPSSLALSTQKDGLAALKASLDRVKIFRHCISAGRADEAFQNNDPDVAVNKLYSIEANDLDLCVSQPSGYGKLAHVNRVAELFVPDSIISNEDNCQSYCLEMDCPPTTTQQNSMQKILSWRKRKLSFKSIKNKGEPLLKKHYGEEGGDDIDFDRRQLAIASNESFSAWYNLELSMAAFGDDQFSVGTWEEKEIMNRDGHLRLQTGVFFASIDQRSERAAGESACTALVAVISDWLLMNEDEMPIRSELDSLIKDGSAEWRNLCDNKDYIERFSDKHFDLDTIIEAKIRPLSVVAEKSYIGFFHPEGLEEGGFEFLQGAMSFDSIWDEISILSSTKEGESDSLVYIVSWNDHFFILKVERDAYYIIDTLGERLYEGCNQAYVLKFDNETKIGRIWKETPSEEPKEASSVQPKTVEDSRMKIEEASTRKPIEGQEKDVPSGKTEQVSGEKNEVEIQDESRNGDEQQEEVICRGKECCKEYIKSFLAAIPIRELQEDVKKGLNSSGPLHQRLQIEFHRTKLSVDQILPKTEPDDHQVD